MSRQLTNQLIADLNSRLPDNNSFLITPAQMRSIITDVIQSLRPAYAMMWGNHNASPKTVSLNSATWTVINGAGFWPNVAQSDASELEYNVANGSFLVKFGGYIHEQMGSMSFLGPNNRILNVSIGYNGIPVGPVASINCDNNQMAILDELVWAPPANAQLQFLAKWADGGAAANITIYHIEVGATLVTTRFL